jgi:hypothetical protein
MERMDKKECSDEEHRTNNAGELDAMDGNITGGHY